MVEIRNLSMARRVGVPVRHFTLSGRSASLIALAGDGKSGADEVLRAVAGLAVPDEGTIAIDGRTVFDAGDGWCQAPAARRVAWADGPESLWPWMTVREHVGDDGVLERFGLAGRASSRPGDLDPFGRMVLSLCRAVALRPALLLLRQPFREPYAEKMAAFLRGHAEDLPPVLLSTDRLPEAFATTDMVGLMREGVLEQCGTARALAADPRNLFVADQASLHAMQHLPVTARHVNFDDFILDAGWIRVLYAPLSARFVVPDRAALVLGVDRSAMRLTADGRGRGTVVSAAGGIVRVRVEGMEIEGCGGGEWRPGMRVSVGLQSGPVQLFDAESGVRVNAGSIS